MAYVPHSAAAIAIANNNDGMNTYAAHAAASRPGIAIRTADAWSSMNTYGSGFARPGIPGNQQLASLGALLAATRTRGPVAYAALTRGG